MKRILVLSAIMAAGSCMMAQENGNDNAGGLEISGYASVAAARSGSGNGGFYIPEMSIGLSYDFGKGWKLNGVLMYDQGDTEMLKALGGDDVGSDDEGSGNLDYEEVWLEKSFSDQFNVRAGKMVVPVGAVNIADPHEQFSIFDGEESQSILPCAWTQFGVNLWGDINDWHYEVMVLQSLNTDNFNTENWIKDGIGNPYGKADNYGGAARIDWNGIDGLRVGVSGYIDRNTSVGSMDFEYNRKKWIVRGDVDYGHVGDADKISLKNDCDIASNALACSFEVGYDVFSLIQKMKERQKLYAYAHYGYYNSMQSVSNSMTADPYLKRHLFSCGLNFRPNEHITVRGEFLNRFMESGIKNQQTTTIGLSYAF